MRATRPPRRPSRAAPSPPTRRCRRCATSCPAVSSPARPERRRRPHPATAAFVVALAGAAAYLIAQARQLWFFGDDWDFLLQRSLTGSGQHGVWFPHNEHWSTLPIVAYRVVFQLFGLGHYLPYALMAIAVHLAVIALLWRLLLDRGCRPWIATGVCSVLAVMGVGAENTLWDFQIGFMGPLAIGLLALLVMPRAAGRRRDAVVLLLVLAALMTSGQGLVVLVVLAVQALLTRGPRYAGLLAGFGVGGYGIWYAVIGHERITETAPITARTVGGVPAVVLGGLSQTWDGLVGLPGVGVIILVVAVLALMRPEPGPLVSLAASCLAGAVTLFVLTGLTRDQSSEQALQGRYAYVAACLMAPAVALALQHLLWPRATSSRITQAVALSVVLGMLVTGLLGVDRYRVRRAGEIGDLQQRLVASVQLARSGQPLLNDQPSAYYNRQIHLAQLLRAADEGRGPSGAATVRGLLDAAAVLQVRVSLSRLGSPAPRLVTAFGAVLGPPGADGCRPGHADRSGAYVELPTDGGLELTFRTSTRRVLTRLVRDGLMSSTASWPTHPHVDQYLASTVPAGAHLQLVFDQPVSFALC